jgi:hypothetical protein
MSFYLAVGAILLWLFFVGVIKELHAEAKNRRDERIMAAYQRQEAARMHARKLASIDRTVQATAEEMERIATEVDSDVIEGTAVEIGIGPRS